MKRQVLFNTSVSAGLIILLAGFLVLHLGCRKTIEITERPVTKYTELKVDPHFEFENFNDVDATIYVPSPKASGMNIIQIFQGNPAEGGKLITTGGLSNGQFNSMVRLPSRLKEVYIAKLASDGYNNYVAVPIVNNAIVYDFSKGGGPPLSPGSVTANDCNSGCTNIVTGTVDNLTVESGEVYCVEDGSSAVFNQLKVNSGGTLKICGTASVNSYNSGGGEGTIIVTPSGTLTLPKHENYFTLENYGSLNISGSKTCKLNGSLHNWGTVNISVKFENKGTIINDGSFTITKKFKNKSGSVFTNNCSFYITEDGNDAFKQEGTFHNNGYVSVEGELEFKSGSTTNLGLNSLMVTEEELKIAGDILLARTHKELS